MKRKILLSSIIIFVIMSVIPVHIVMAAENTCEHKRTANEIVKKANFSRNGKVNTICEKCSEIVETRIVPQIGKVSLSKTKYTYNGKNIKPKVIIKDVNGKTISNKYYKINYPPETKYIDTYTVAIVFRKEYCGLSKRTFHVLPKSKWYFAEYVS